MAWHPSVTSEEWASSAYTAMGDVVNRALRLESCIKEIAVDLVLGETTYQFATSITGPFDAVQLYTVRLKGYNAVHVYGAAFQSLENVIRRIETACQAKKQGHPGILFRI